MKAGFSSESGQIPPKFLLLVEGDFSLGGCDFGKFKVVKGSPLSRTLNSSLIFFINSFSAHLYIHSRIRKILVSLTLMSLLIMQTTVNILYDNNIFKEFFSGFPFFVQSQFACICIFKYLHQQAFTQSNAIQEMFCSIICKKGKHCLKLCDCNGTRTHNHLVRKRTLNHLAKLVQILGS